MSKRPPVATKGLQVIQVITRVAILQKQTTTNTCQIVAVILIFSLSPKPANRDTSRFSKQRLNRSRRVAKPDLFIVGAKFVGLCHGEILKVDYTIIGICVLHRYSDINKSYSLWQCGTNKLTIFTKTDPMTKTELVFVPTPAMGHLLSMVEFAKLIVRTNPDISILVLIYHIAISVPTKVKSYIESQSRELDPTQIAFITLPPLSNPPDRSHPAFYRTAIQLQNPLVKKVVQDRQFKTAAFVLDLMNASMIDIANELHVPSYIYFAAGANFLHTLLHFQGVADEQGIDDFTGLMGDPDTELDIPGFMNRVPIKVLPWVFFGKDTVWPSLMLDLTRRFREAKGILVNSFAELEAITIQVLQRQENIPTIYPVGPILSLENRLDFKPSNNGISSLRKNDQDSIISWLDGQPESSVVFLCFGSMGSFDAEQVKEIAEGLDHSGQRFLWSLRKPAQVGTFGVPPSEHLIFEDALPEGFIDRTAHKGKIIPWAPQVAVLAHQAIGGFVSHCGWNSILESIWFGVPLATWPLYAEQQLNAFTLVKELGLAVEIKLDYRWDARKQQGNYLVKAEEVENGLMKLMTMDDEMRSKVREMSVLSRKVLQTNDGFSRVSLTRFIAEINENTILSLN